MSINACPQPYRVEQGRILLKDAAVLAGLGVMGKNNLVITPQLAGLCVTCKWEKMK
ncbi:MAG: hypothetical protein H8D43_02260 [Chloroflexi bacterium]|nr:hypothetical protein [Chloroflexota bacterium]